MSRAQFAAILLAGAVVRAAALPGPGTGDVTIFKVWSYNAARAGVSGMYGVGGSPPERRLLEYIGTTAVVDYPPLALYELGLAGRLHRLWSGRRFPNNAALNAAVKLPSVAADIGFLILIFGLVRRYFGDASARWAAVAYWLNPAPIIDASVLGYLDVQSVAPASAAIVAAAHAWPALAGALIAAAMLTKAQGVFVAPAVALAIWTCGRADRRVARVASAAVAALAVTAVLVAPVVVAGGWPNMVQALSRLAHHDSLSAQACNLWWIVGYVLRVRYSAADMGVWAAITAPARILGIPRVVELGYPDPRIIGAALTVGAMLWALWTVFRTTTRTAIRAATHPAIRSAIRSPQSAMSIDVWLLAGVGGFLVHAYATLSAQVHENHLFAAVPLLAIAAAGRRGFRPILLVVSVVIALNLNLFYGFGDDVYALPRGLTVIDATVVLAVVNCAALWGHARILRRECSAASAPRPTPAPA